MTSSLLLIHGAEVIDGSGAPRVEADVLIEDDRIAAVAPPGGIAAPPRAERVDARGLVLCPGFIDTHAHDDLLVLQPEAPNPKLAQGVCTVVTGNCGLSLAPLLTTSPPPPLDILGLAGVTIADFPEYLARIDAARPTVNTVPLIGHTSLRLKHVAAIERSASATEIDTMRDELSAALAAGAFGLSTGVYYPPARAASTDELLGVSAALRAFPGALLAMHLRDEGDRIEQAIDEALQVAGACDATLLLSHHKVVGPRNHGKTRQTLRTVDAAAQRQAVCLDCYPYAASSTMLDPARAAAVGDVMITWSVPHPQACGRKLRAIADEWGVSLHEAAQRLLPGGAIYFALADEDVERVLVHPLTMIGSDGLPHDRHPHPRLWGTFPRVLGHYSRERGLFPLETAVHKMTGLPARRFGLADRGRIAAGCAADLVLFDAARIADRASYEQPEQPPAGVHSVWVNGRLALRDGQVLQRHAGRRLMPAR